MPNITMQSIWIWILLSATSLVSSRLTFHGDKVFRVKLQTEEHVTLIQCMDKKLKLDFWHPDSAEQLAPKMDVDFHVNVNHTESIQSLLEQNAIEYEVLVHNLQESVEAQLDNKRTQKNKKHMYRKYNEWEEIVAWTDKMATKYPEVVSRLVIGTTYEGRDMYVLQIGKPSAKTKAIFMDCGIHAREWISPAFCQWFVRELTKGSSKKKSILNKLTFYILPVFNIDGYIWSWTEDRMWRKNRSPTTNGKCLGADLNRNFNASWCNIGASHRPCSETYCGSSAESEKESKNVANFIRSHLESIKAYISIHSYSQLLLYPYGYKFKLPVNAEELNELSKGAVVELSSLYGTTYEYGPSSTTIYPTSGSSADWAYDLGIKYSFTFELRDKGMHGFLLPESELPATCKETTLAVNYIANYVLHHSS
ncbi:carboxypeptidase B-like [Discoglossus pictus]